MNHPNEPNGNLLHKIVIENRPAELKLLLQNGTDASIVDDEGNTPLHVAASMGFSHMVEILLKYSSREKLKKFINAKNSKNGNTALHIAAIRGCVKSARHLLIYGANFEVKNDTGKRAFEVADRDLETKKLLGNVEADFKLATQGQYMVLQMKMFQYSDDDLKATVLARNANGQTSLQIALVNSHANTVQTIIEMRVERLRRNYPLQDETTMLDLINHGKKLTDNASSLMLHSQDINMLDSETISSDLAEILAAAHGIVKVAEKAFKPKDEPYEQLALLAVVEEALEALQFKAGHVTYKKDGQMIFNGHKARYYKMLHIHEDEDDEDYDNFEDEDKIVIYMGILQSSITRPIVAFMQTIFTVQLSEAAKHDDFEMFEKCADEEAIDMNVTNAMDDRQTPLHYASRNGNDKMIEILLKKRAKVSAVTDTNHETALHLAANRGHEIVVRMLLQATRGEETKRYVDMKTKNEGWTALHFAAKAGYVGVMKILMRFGATYNLKGRDGKTPRQLSEDPMLKKFFDLVDQLFVRAKNGDTSLQKGLRDLQLDDLLAVGYVRDTVGQTLEKAAAGNGHRNVASTIARIVVDATPKLPEIRQGQDCDEAFYDVQRYQLIETLGRSST